MKLFNRPVSNLLRPLIKSAENAFAQGWPGPKVKYSNDVENFMNK